MATGRPAFAAPDQASLIAAILDREPAGISEVASSVPESFSKIIAKCLAKNPIGRWSSAAQMAAELRRVTAAPLRRGRAAAVRSVERSRIRSLAVLPLQDFSRRSKGLRVISRTSAVRYRDAAKPLSQVASELNVDGLLEGSIFRSAGRVRLLVRLIDATTDTQIGPAHSIANSMT